MLTVRAEEGEEIQRRFETSSAQFSMTLFAAVFLQFFLPFVVLSNGWALLRRRAPLSPRAA